MLITFTCMSGLLLTSQGAWVSICSAQHHHLKGKQSRRLVSAVAGARFMAGCTLSTPVACNEVHSDAWRQWHRQMGFTAKVAHLFACHIASLTKPMPGMSSPHNTGSCHFTAHLCLQDSYLVCLELKMKAACCLTLLELACCGDSATNSLDDGERQLKHAHPPLARSSIAKHACPHRHDWGWIRHRGKDVI